MKTEDYIRQSEEYTAHNYEPLPVVLTRGEGVFVWDVEGKRYFDMLASYSALTQGHVHPRILEAAKKQIKRLTLTSRAFFNDRMGEFCRKLSQLTGMDKVLLMNSGAEAVETAIKAMRKWGYEVKKVKQPEIIVCENNFHGRTTTIVGFSTDKKTSGNFGPPTPGFRIIPYNDADALEEAINENTVGFLVEPIQGEAGVIIPDDDYLKKAREICDKHKVLLALDEVQTGFGRTGKLFCYEHNNIKPDILIMGKGLSGGFYPISGIAADNEVMKVFTPGTHGSTFGGNPLASAIGIAAVDVVVDEKLSEKSMESGNYLLERLKEIKNPRIKEVRGKGFFLAIEFTEGIAQDYCLKLMKEGVLAKSTHETTIRFTPPLIMTKEQIGEAFGIIRGVLEKS